jgi:hypothetical protein
MIAGPVQRSSLRRAPRFETDEACTFPGCLGASWTLGSFIGLLLVMSWFQEPSSCKPIFVIVYTMVPP